MSNDENSPILCGYISNGQQPQMQHCHQRKLCRSWPDFLYGICPYMGRVRIICCKFNISVILSPSTRHWYCQRPSISLLFSTTAAFIVVSYYGYMEVLWKQKVAARPRRHVEWDIISPNPWEGAGIAWLHRFRVTLRIQPLKGHLDTRWAHVLIILALIFNFARRGKSNRNCGEGCNLGV